MTRFGDMKSQFNLKRVSDEMQKDLRNFLNGHLIPNEFQGSVSRPLQITLLFFISAALKKLLSPRRRTWNGIGRTECGHEISILFTKEDSDAADWTGKVVNSKIYLHLQNFKYS